MTCPRVAVVVPVYNGASTIEPCLKSLLALDYPADSIQIIVVENGSTDDSRAVIQKYPVRLMHSDPPGPSLARQRGIEAADGDIVAFTDADCVVHPRWLAELIVIYDDPRVGGVGGPILPWVSEQPNMVELFSERFPPLVNFVSGPGEFLPHLFGANASYRRSLLERVGGFNPDLLTAEDVDLCWRLQLETGARVSFAADAIVYHRHRHDRSDLGNQYRVYGFGEILLDTIFGGYSNYPRTRTYQVWRMLGQLLALPRYASSAIVRRYRRALGQISDFDAAIPDLWLLIESQNLLGKLEAIIATRGMTTVAPRLRPPRSSRLADT